MLALLRPRETWEGSRGPLIPTNYLLFNPIRCPKIGVHFNQTLDGGCSSYKFLTADNAYEILALSSKHGRGVFVVVGKESWMQEAEAQATEGFLFFDGCPWPCMGGVLSPFKANSLPIVQPGD